MSDTLHYKGDCANFDPDHIMGPDMFGAYYRTAAAEYDRVADRTTLTLLPIPPAELRLRQLELYAEANSCIRIEQLFGTVS